MVSAFLKHFVYSLTGTPLTECETEELGVEKGELSATSSSSSDGYPASDALATDGNGYWMSSPEDDSPSLDLATDTTARRQVLAFTFKVRQSYVIEIHCGSNSVSRHQIELYSEQLKIKPPRYLLRKT